MKRALIFLTSFVGLTAIAGGLLLVLYPDGSIMHLPSRMLQFTPFRNFIIPGLILASIVGGANILSAVHMISGRPQGLAWSMWSGIILCGWLIIQMLLIRGAGVLHLLYGVAGIAVIILTWRLAIHQPYSTTKYF